MNNEKLILEALWCLLSEGGSMPFGEKRKLIDKIKETVNPTKSEEPYSKDLPKRRETTSAKINRNDAINGI